MWYAQMSLWIQEDVVAALAQLNEAAAKRIAAQGGEEKPWVGNLPVKHIIGIRIGSYLRPTEGEVQPMSSGGSGGQTERLLGTDPTNSAASVFTHRGGSETIDIIQFNLHLVVEAASLPAVIDAVARAGFYTPLLVNYVTVPPNPELLDYIYGPEPSIEVQLDFEGAFLRNKYEAWIPQVVVDAIKTGQAGPSGNRSGGGGGRQDRMSAPGGRGFPGGSGGGDNRPFRGGS
jgi:hypothetical protein